MRRLPTVLIAAVVSSSLALAACADDNAGQTVETSATPLTTSTTDAAASTTDPGTTQPDATTSDATTSATTVPGDPLAGRPFDVIEPSSYDSSTAVPLVVLLHGFGASGALQEAYLQLAPLAEERGFLLVHPDGTINAIDRQFWNATEACCGFNTTVDDSAYLTALVEQVEADYNVDPKRIYFVGHSNGGFMSYRMACEHADKVAAIVSLAGATFSDPTHCDPSEPVSILQIHGTADETIAYEGGKILGGTFPSAHTTVQTWAAYDECDDTPEGGAPIDLESSLPGDETSVSVYGNCSNGTTVQLWTIEAGRHIPSITRPNFSEQIIDFLFAHPKP